LVRKTSEFLSILDLKSDFETHLRPGRSAICDCLSTNGCFGMQAGGGCRMRQRMCVLRRCMLLPIPTLSRVV
jgi:hypothetical protein